MNRAASETMAKSLLSLLTLREEDDNHFIGSATPDDHRVGTGRVFGGQVVAQALLAAETTAPHDRAPGSFHCRFLRPGNVEKPIHYRVARDLDGRSFTHRRVVADQGDQPILTCSVMFHAPERAIAHQPPMPAVPSPDEARTILEQERDGNGPHANQARRFLSASRPLEFMPIDIAQWDATEGRDEPVRGWIRFGTDLPDDPRIHRAVLGYVSDMTLLRSADVRHGLSWFRKEVVQASLDHMIWFHDDFRADQWMYYETESPWAGHGRALTRGQLFAPDGRLIASTTQEGLERLLK